MQKIAILGYGVEGQSVAKWLTKNNYNDITICDKNESLQVDSAYKTNLGPNYLEGLTEFDTIFRSPGIHVDSPQIQEAYDAGATITSATKLFFKQCPGKIIGITGTKGKGTTSTLIYEILKAAGHDVHLGGNIGQSPLDFVDQVNEKSLVVLELSSFQLHDLHKSPHIAVVLNVTSEHLDYHFDTHEYREAKASIVRYQKNEDFAIFNKDYPSHTRFLEQTSAHPFFVSTKQKVEHGAYIKNGEIILNIKNHHQFVLCGTDDAGLIGPHNLENILPAATAATLLNVEPETIVTTIKSFTGLPHRLELCGTINEARYYNDSFSSVPETAIAALRSFTEPTVIMLGGSEKHSDFTELAKEITRSPHLTTVILMGDTAPRIKEALEKAESRKAPTYTTLTTNSFPEAFQTAQDHAEPGGVVLLSPACASFDWFKNYKYRGDTFRKMVQEAA